MAEKEKNKGPKKRRWYNNLYDAFKITKRTFPWVGWVMLVSTIAVIALFVWLGVTSKLSVVFSVLFGVTFAFMVPMLILSLLVKKAMYRQVEGTIGSVYAVVSQIQRGWTVDEQPIAANRHQDLVWRLIGRPGVVFVTEGPTGRVRDLVEKERKSAQRIVTNVPTHVINVGQGKDQVKLEDLEKQLRRLPKTLRRKEVPLVVSRLQAMDAQRRQSNIPHGVDPTKAKISRRAFRGK